MDNENKYPDWDTETDEFEKTQEMNSVPLSPNSTDESRAIMPRDEFIENNSVNDLEKTMRMDSLKNNVPVQQNRPSSANPVKKRKKKKKQTNHTRTMGQIFLGSVISVAAIGIGVALAINVINGIRDFTGMSKPSNQVEITISDNMTPASIADTLHSNGIIESPWLFKTYLKLSKNEESFREGIHIVSSNMSYGSIINALGTRMEYTETVDVVIPEGLTASEIGKILEDNMVCRAVDFVKCYKDKINKYDFEEGIPTNVNRFYALEGYIFPDTYQFYVNKDLERNPNFDTSEYAMTVVEKMYDNFEDKITKDMKKRMKELDMTLDEVITLASLIEWEGTNEENMANISSVFHNRLNDPENFPKLQSNTTYTYISRVIEPNTKSLSTEKAQAIKNAYDTYNAEGLPPGPICNPGLMAINAALYPSQTNYYYFLASDDGVFYWARTLEEHEQNEKDAALHAGEEE